MTVQALSQIDKVCIIHDACPNLEAQAHLVSLSPSKLVRAPSACAPGHGCSCFQLKDRLATHYISNVFVVGIVLCLRFRKAGLPMPMLQDCILLSVKADGTRTCVALGCNANLTAQGL